MKKELEVAAIITALRLEHGYTKKDVARAIKVSPTTYAKFERGEGRMTSKHIMLLADLYLVSCDYLLGLSDVRHPIRKRIITN